jgi:hypothetical protein
MKQITLAILASFLMLGFSVNGTASPTPSRCQVTVYVPFSFQVAGRIAPAGYYRFEQVLGSTEGVEVLVVRSIDRQFYQAVATNVAKMDDTQFASRVVFRHSGENLVMSGLCSRIKHVSIALYGAGTKQPVLVAGAENPDEVVLAVPADGELLAMTRSTR